MNKLNLAILGLLAMPTFCLANGAGTSVPDYCAFEDSGFVSSQFYEPSEQKTFQMGGYNDGGSYDESLQACQNDGYSDCHVVEEGSESASLTPGGLFSAVFGWSGADWTQYSHSYSASKVVGVKYRLKSKRQIVRQLCPTMTTCHLQAVSEANQSRINAIERLDAQLGCGINGSDKNLSGSFAQPGANNRSGSSDPYKGVFPPAVPHTYHSMSEVNGLTQGPNGSYSGYYEDQKSGVAMACTIVTTRDNNSEISVGDRVKQVCFEDGNPSAKEVCRFMAVQFCESPQVIEINENGLALLRYSNLPDGWLNLNLLEKVN